MKRLLYISPLIMCIFHAFFPICIFIGVIFGYDFSLRNYPVYIMGLTVVSFAATILMFVSLNKVNAVFSALLLPLTVINSLFLVLRSDWNITVFITLIICTCSIVIFIRFAYPTILRRVLMGTYCLYQLCKRIQ